LSAELSAEANLLGPGQTFGTHVTCHIRSLVALNEGTADRFSLTKPEVVTLRSTTVGGDP
jgi:hypothetical protein